MVDIGAAGTNHDSAIFKASKLSNLLLSIKLYISPPKALSGSNLKIPNYLVGDTAFPLHGNIIRAYSGTFVDKKNN